MRDRRLPLLRVAAALAAVGWIPGCGDGATEPPPPDPPRATTVTVTPAADTLVAFGDTLRLTAEVRDQHGRPMAGAAVAWSSGNTAVATVDASGLVTGVAAGAVEITATSSGVPGSAALTVVDPAPTTVAVTPDTVALTALGQTARLSAEVRDQAGRPMEGVPVFWSSADTTVATVDSVGLVTAVGGGRTTVAAAAGDVPGEAVVTVMQSADSVVVTPTEATVAVGDTLRLMGEAFDENGHAVAGAEFTWSSSDGSVATVDGSGLVTGVAQGTATITASAGSASGAAEITVPNPDRAALVALYEATGGPQWIRRTNWLTDTPLGDWHGVTVDGDGRVVGLNLKDNGLEGEIPPEIGGLRHLRELWLFSNRLHGEIPPEIGELANAIEISLSDNRLTGQIPLEIGNLASLWGLWLDGNQLTGPVPASIADIPRLRDLGLAGNRLTGLLPSTMTRLALTSFYWHQNDTLCLPGSPAFVKWLGTVRFFAGSRCNQADRETLESLYWATGGGNWKARGGWLDNDVVGEWHGVSADSLGQVLALDLSDNGLTGSLPAHLGRLERLTRLRVGENILSGRLPLSLSRLSLVELDYEGTDLCVPAEARFREWLGQIATHTGTGLDCPPLSDREVLETLYGATRGDRWTHREGWLTDAPIEDWYGVGVDAQGRVTELVLSRNGLEGPLPAELGGLSGLRRLDLSGNRLSGPLPDELGVLSRLEHLNLASNRLSGAIPPALGQLARLETLSLSANRFTGPLPAALGNLTRLVSISAAWNDIEGPIPPALGNPGSSLRYVRLHDNRLTGAIPPELANLAGLDGLWLNDNRLSGALPAALGRLSGMRWLSLAGNELSGTLPPEFGGLRRLERLDLSDNDLAGAVPAAFGRLTALRELDLRRNGAMTGALPLDLTALTNLDRLLAGGTNLCAPTETSFLDWLAGIETRRVAACRLSGSQAVVLTQAVQSRRFPVTLVAGEKALLRVFVTAPAGGGAATPPVRATFYLGSTETHAVDLPGRSAPMPATVDESDLSASSNAEIPGAVVQPGLEVVVEIDPDGTLDPSLGVARRIPETGRLAVDVEAVPRFDLTVVPFLWSERPDSSILEVAAEMASDPGGHEALRASRTLLPVAEVAVRAREPVLSSTNDGRALLRQTEAIRILEGGRGHYLGMMTGRVVGARAAALRPGRASFAVPDSRNIARQFGYNMGLGNAPCATWPFDPAFPNPDGSIGSWGYDFQDGGRLVSPRTPDLMSRCSPAWISGYHFDAALRHRLSDESGAARAAGGRPVRTILLWGGLDDEGIPFLEPAFVTASPPALPGSGGPYEIVGSTEEGQRLFSLDFEMMELVDDDGGSARVFAFALPASEDWAGALSNITLSGPGGSSTLNRDDDRSMALVRDAGTGRVRGIIQGRAVAHGEARGLDVVYSGGVPRAEDWRR